MWKLFRSYDDNTQQYPLPNLDKVKAALWKKLDVDRIFVGIVQIGRAGGGERRSKIYNYMRSSVPLQSLNYYLLHATLNRFGKVIDRFRQSIFRVFF